MNDVITKQVTEKEFLKYCSQMTDGGFMEKQTRSIAEKQFVAYLREEEGVYLNYYKNTGELTIVSEKESKYFSFFDKSEAVSVSPQITQLHLEDFGMSYVIRLSDGRYIVIDGGRELEPDADRLMECLRDGAENRKPIIAAWIMTHPHTDHYYCFFPFIEKYREEIVIEKFLFNFPEADDMEHYPKLIPAVYREEGHTANPKMLQFLEIVKELSVQVYTPHTGQIYQIGDAVLEILACMDDTISNSNDVNATSLVIRMELGGQVILWATDASFHWTHMKERYGTCLKADILQVPHHGFGHYGTGMGQEADIQNTMDAYKLISPKVCLLPASDYSVFTAKSIFLKCVNYLMTECGVQELITGEHTRTLTLPYKADVHGAEKLHNQILAGMENAGARTWIFTELDTSRPEDFQYTILNTTHNTEAEIWIDLFFEDEKSRICFIKATVSHCSLKKICIIDKEDVETNAFLYNGRSLEKKGVPEAVPFAIRFMSKIPVVVSNPHHEASYRTAVHH